MHDLSQKKAQSVTHCEICGSTVLHIALQNITTCSYCRRYRQSTYLPKAAFTFTAYGFLLLEFTSFENVSDDFKIEIAEQFVQIKWKVLHSPKFVSLMMFLVQTSVHTCSNHCQTSPQKNSSRLSFSLFQLLFFWWVGTSKTATLLVWAFFFTKATDLVAPQRSHILFQRRHQRLSMTSQTERQCTPICRIQFLQIYIAEIMPNLATGQFLIFLNIEYNSKLMQNVDL